MSGNIRTKTRRICSGADRLTDPKRLTRRVHKLPHQLAVFRAGMAFDAAGDIDSIWKNRLDRLANIRRC
jgi:hypothetical protein